MRIIKQVISLSWVLLLPAFITSCAWIESLQNPTAATTEAPVLEPTKFKILLIDTPQVKFYDFASFKYGKADRISLLIYIN